MELELADVTKRYDGTDGAAVDDLTSPSRRARPPRCSAPRAAASRRCCACSSRWCGPTRGEVRVDGAPLAPRAIEPLRRRIGYVIQDGGLFPHLTAADNVTLMARHLRWDAARVARPARRAARRSPASPPTPSTATRPSSRADRSSGWP